MTVISFISLQQVLQHTLTCQLPTMCYYMAVKNQETGKMYGKLKTCFFIKLNKQYNINPRGLLFCCLLFLVDYHRLVNSSIVY